MMQAISAMLQMMAQPGQYLSVFIPEKMFKQIERFRYQKQIPSRVEAIRMLVSRGLIYERLGVASKKSASKKPK